MTSAHLLDSFLHATENWLYRRLLGLRRYSPLVFTTRLLNEQQYHLPGLRCFHRLPRWRRALYRLPIGPFGPSERHLNFYWREMVSTECRVLHSHFATVAKHHSSFRRWAQHRLAAATITSFYGYDLRELGQTSLGDGKKLLDEETAFVVEGAHMAERLVSAGCRPDKVYVNALGIDCSFFPERANSRDTEQLRVLTVGRFVPKKGIPDAISAVALARSRGIDITLTVAGDGVLRPEIESILRREQAAEYVTLAGNVDYATLRALYYDHDVLLQPSVTASDGDSEGGAPVCLVEGMAAGLAVVATRHADIPNVVVAGRNGLLVNERRPDRLADSLCRLATDRAVREDFSRNGRKHVLENFDSKVQARKLEAIYDRVLGG